MKLRLAILLILIAILVVYSPEVEFMPNYVKRPDQWHLLIPMIIFYTSFAVVFLWSLLRMVRQRKIIYNLPIFILLSVFAYAPLNDPKGDSTENGYIAIIILLFVHAVYFNLKRKEIKNKNKLK